MLWALKTELILRKNELQNDIIETIYFGGGTPSLLKTEDIEELLAVVKMNYQVADAIEITLEANPDDLSEAKIIAIANSSINRLSIGIQSFFNDDLQMMNRAHNAQEAKNSLAIATRFFNNITIDLIYGIPNMSHKKWKENLHFTFDLGIHHISSYALTIEPKTALDSFIQKGKFPVPKEKEAREHYEILVNETHKQGFVHYEISNFGKPNYFSKHNTSYWLGKKYLGIGPSAHSFNKTHRSWNISNNNKYIKDIKSHKLPNEIEKLSIEDRFNEYLMTGLRTIWGVSLSKIRNEFGETNYLKLLQNAQKFIDQKLLSIEMDTGNHKVLKTTQKGKFLADGLASDLFII